MNIFIKLLAARLLDAPALSLIKKKIPLVYFPSHFGGDVGETITNGRKRVSETLARWVQLCVRRFPPLNRSAAGVWQVVSECGGICLDTETFMLGRCINRAANQIHMS